MKKFFNSPITWGQSITLSLLIMPISFVMTLHAYGLTLSDVVECLVDNVKDLFKKPKEG